MLFNQLVYCRFRLSPSIWSRNRRISTRTPSWSGHKRSTRTRAAGHTCSHVSSLRWTTVVTLGEYLIPYHVRHTSPLNSERETLKKPMKPCPNKLHSLFSLSLTLFLSLFLVLFIIWLHSVVFHFVFGLFDFLTDLYLSRCTQRTLFSFTLTEPNLAHTLWFPFLSLSL